MRIPNQDDLDFRNFYFSFREENGVLFHRIFVERTSFFPFGELLNSPMSESVKVVILGESDPIPGELNQIISDRLHILSEAFEYSFGQYVDLIGVDDFSERLEDGEEVRVCDPGNAVYGRKLMTEDLLVMWKKRELHQIVELEEVTYVPSSGRLGLLFRIDWEVWLGDQCFALLIEGDKVDYGIDQAYAGFCREDSTGWFTTEVKNNGRL